MEFLEGSRVINLYCRKGGVSLVKITIDELQQKIIKRLLNEGVQQEHAEIVADVLTYAEARGIQSHGVIRMAPYVVRVQKGHIRVQPNIQVTPINEAVVKIDGDHGFGHVIAKIATDEAMKCAQKMGIGLTVVAHTTHCGAVGYYADYAAKHGMIALLFTQADTLVAPFGAKDAYLGVNPITYGIPNGDEPIVLDMSTSEAAFGKIMMARQNGEAIPDTWGLDEAGYPTTNPNHVEALQPTAGAKGSGLALLVDILAGILPGENERMYEEVDKRRDLGQFVIVIDPTIFMAPETFADRMQSVVKGLRAATPAPKFNQVQLPGDRSREKMEKSEQQGIELKEDYIAFLDEE